jgi:pseudouridine-5'-monophosphatase
MMGRPPPQAAQILVDELELPMTNMQYLEKAKAGFTRLFPTASLMPGVKRLVHHLHSNGIPMALATGSATRDYHLKITKHRDLFQLFEHVVLGDDPDIKNGKPAPDCFLTAMARFKPAPPHSSNVLVFEDAPNGIAAAGGAGMWTVMVPDKRIDPAMTKNAHLVLKSLEDFDPVAWGLPTF